MREHQILLSLKSNQFQEVERLAKASGFKSVGLFARQQLLAGLNPEAAPVAARSINGFQTNLKVVVQQLTRLHKELKVFVTESLNNNEYLDSGSHLQSSVNFADDNTSDEPTPAKAWRYYELPTGPIIENAALVNDELEELADRAFISSPQLGALAPSKEIGSLYDLLDEHFIARGNEAAEETL